MNISKSLPLMCVLAVCSGLVARADDNAAQAAARAALIQKMQQMDSGQSDDSTSPPIAPAPATGNQAPPMAVPTPESQVPRVETPSTPVISEPEPETKPKMTPQTEPPPAPAETPVAPDVAAPKNSAQAEEQAIISRHSPQAEAPANVLPPPNETAPQPSAEMPAPQKRGFFSRILHPFHQNRRSAVTEERRMKPAAPEYSNKNRPDFAPVVPPPPPVSPEQDAQLQALLEKYKANQISPEQYQNERAAIIGPQ
jgi:hypothetical protein